MVERVLITTADENTWIENEPVVFLGEWCKRFSRKNKWEKLDSITVPHHWDDGSKFKGDYLYLNKVYEDMLIDFVDYLNNFHSVNYSIRYWRILIGPWLGVFIQVLFDRMTMLDVAVKNYEIKECIALEGNIDELVPKDGIEFNSMIVSDSWNEGFYAQLIKNYFSKDIKLKIKACVKQSDNQEINSYESSKSRIIKMVENLLAIIFSSKSDKFFFIGTYLPLFNEIKLQIKLLQGPKRWPRIKLNFIKKYKALSRKWNKNSNRDEFSKIAYEMSILYIPTAYLENYEDLVNLIPVYWPRNPNVIFTSTSWFSDEIFKVWTAKKCENGSNLIIGQHGGHFGMSEVSFFEKHQIDISDNWISWGWSDPKRPKIIQGFNFKEKNHKIIPNYKGLGLVVTMTTARYSNRMMRCTISAGQWNAYFKDIRNFISFLKPDIQEKMTIRTARLVNYYRCDEEVAWKSYFPLLNMSDTSRSIYDEMKNSKIYISTYNATSYLESLYFNFPTIIFWNEEHWEVKSETQEYLNLLESVGIFHRNPYSAAKKLEEIWDDIPNWWSSKDVQNARNLFCNKFAHRVQNPSDQLKAILLDKKTS